MKKWDDKKVLKCVWNCTPNKFIICDYRETQWMTNNVIKSLKERSELTKYFYKNGHREGYHDKVLKK